MKRALLVLLDPWPFSYRPLLPVLAIIAIVTILLFVAGSLSAQQPVAGFGDWYDHRPNIQIQFNFGDWFVCPSTAPCTQAQAVPATLKSTPVHVDVMIDGTKTWIYPDRVVSGRLNAQCWTLTIARDDITKKIRPMMTVAGKYLNGVDSQTVLGFEGTDEPIGTSAATTCTGVAATSAPLAAMFRADTLDLRALDPLHRDPPMTCDEGCQLLAAIAERQERPATMMAMAMATETAGGEPAPVQRIVNANSGDYPVGYSVRPWCERNERNEPRSPADRKACYARNPDTILNVWIGPGSDDRRVILLLGGASNIMQGFSVAQLATSPGYVAIPVDMREGGRDGRQFVEVRVSDRACAGACGEVVVPQIEVALIPFAPAASAQVSGAVRRRAVVN